VNECGNPRGSDLQKLHIFTTECLKEDVRQGLAVRLVPLGVVPQRGNNKLKAANTKGGVGDGSLAELADKLDGLSKVREGRAALLLHRVRGGVTEQKCSHRSAEETTRAEESV
jgi:hypothetical protein